MNLKEEARELECVQKEAKPELLKVKGFDGDAWLDVRDNQISFYVYGENGVDNTAETPREITQLKRKKQAEGTAKLGEFA